MGNVSNITSFKWEENVFSINEKLKKFIKSIKTYDEESNIGYIFEADVEYLKIYKIFRMIYHFCLKEWKF